jgi:two-component sensor histidine kinase
MTPQSSHTEKRASEILEVIMSYARLDFTVKTELSNKGDVLDAIGSGVNMLGEELKISSVSVKEKDQLLREIHHRVKNNMQIISSLLNLQSENEKDERFLALIRDSRNRINAMAFIHEMLYASTDFKYTNFNAYVNKLTSSLSSSYSEASFDVLFRIDIDKQLKFDVDTMIPLGLIINEIITNSFKYAFIKETPSKIISILLEQNPCSQKNHLYISDNGIGLPKNFNLKKQSSLGMQLIFLLSEQIGGKVEMIQTKGTVYKIVF